MAPPGAPQGYIPSAFREKIPVPYGMDSNTRAYAIFFSYLGACIGLTAFIIQRLFKNFTVLSKSKTAQPPPKKYVYLFVLLAIGSLGTTWYHMLLFFRWSYRTWLMWRQHYQLTTEMTHWGLWLSETSLFKEAWEAVLVGFARYWWSNQIFFFALALGLDLERKGIRRNIKHTWVFMLLGQIVAISFATNLFIIAQLLSPPPVVPTTENKKRWFGPWLLNAITVFATVIPAFLLAAEEYWYGHAFFSLLMIPHVALLVIPVIRSILPAKYFSDENVPFADRAYKILWVITIGGGLALGLNMTGAAVRYGGYEGIITAWHDHPAVSSVAYDAIFCWVTWLAWTIIKTVNSGDVFVREKEATEYSFSDNGSSTVVSGGAEGNGAVRRR